MKSLENFIKESIEIEKGETKDTRTIILVKRTGIDSKNITKEDFCKFMIDDFNEAIKKGNELLDKEFENGRKERVEKARQDAEKYAEATWKRASKKKEFIDSQVKDAEEKKRDKYTDFKTFNFDIYFGQDNAIPAMCILSEDDLKKKVEYIYDHLTGNGKIDYHWTKEKSDMAKEMFYDSTGWVFKYEASNDSYYIESRPYVELLNSDSKKKEINKNKEKLTKSINKFYSNSNYWGD